MHVIKVKKMDIRFGQLRCHRQANKNTFHGLAIAMFNIGRPEKQTDIIKQFSLSSFEDVRLLQRDLSAVKARLRKQDGSPMARWEALGQTHVGCHRPPAT